MRLCGCVFFFSSRRRHTRCSRDWSSDVCSSDLVLLRRSIRALSAMRQSGSQQQVRTSLYVVAGAALLVVVGAIVFPWVYKPWRPAKGSVQHEIGRAHV